LKLYCTYISKSKFSDPNELHTFLKKAVSMFSTRSNMTRALLYRDENGLVNTCNGALCAETVANELDNPSTSSHELVAALVAALIAALVMALVAVLVTAFVMALVAALVAVLVAALMAALVTVLVAVLVTAFVMALVTALVAALVTALVATCSRYLSVAHNGDVRP
jgi:hypothetical protein